MTGSSGTPQPGQKTLEIISIPSGDDDDEDEEEEDDDDEEEVAVFVEISPSLTAVEAVTMMQSASTAFKTSNFGTMDATRAGDET